MVEANSLGWLTPQCKDALQYFSRNLNMELLEYHFGAGVRAFSTLRNSGGMGEGAYAAFNITHYCGDDPANVSQCREALAEELGIPMGNIVLPHQTHTTNVQVLDEAWLQCSLQERVYRLQNVDAVVTNLRRCCIGVSTADCVPVLLYDAQQQIIAAAHAGWRGMVGHILRNTVESMVNLGANPADITAVVGPSIGASSFEVGDEVVEAFVSAGFPWSIVQKDQRLSSNSTLKPHIDLWAAASFELEQMGIPLTNLQIAGVDTYMHSDSFFSARRLGIQSGRIYSGILLKNEMQRN